MRIALFLLAGLLFTQSAASSVSFEMHRLDDGQSETAALADVNGDGRLDVVSSESWYEAPGWTKRPIRSISFTNNYVDNFSDLPLDVDEDGFTDIIQIAYFARRIAWMKNPGRSGGPWIENEIDAVGPTEFAFLVDLNNDSKANDLLPQFTGAAQQGLTWYELRNGKWIKRQVSSRSYGHGIGAGDVNGDGRADILTPQGWLEAPADVRAPGEWAFHATDWSQPKIPIGMPPQSQAAAPAPANPPAASSMFIVERGGSRVATLQPIAAEFRPSPPLRLPAEDLKLTVDGQSVAGLGFNARMQGDRAEVIVYAMVPRGAAPEYEEVPRTLTAADGSTRQVVSRRLINFEDREHARYTIPLGGSAEVGGTNAEGGSIALRIGPGTLPQGGGRTSGQPPPVRVEYGFMHVLDINTDGRNDVLTTMGHSFGVLWIEQKADGTWQQHLIDNSWSRAHASVLADVNGDGRFDLVTGTRFMGRNAQETEPLALYWYEYRAPASSPGAGTGGVTWTKHVISSGADAGGGLQIVAGDVDRDGDIDIVSGGKSGLFLGRNLRR